MQIKNITIAGEDVRIGVQRGQGTPLIICSELGANLELAQPLMQALPDAEIVVFDVPGAGQSSQRRGFRRMGGYARLLRELLKALHYSDPVDLLGVGWGGLLVQKFAYQFPENARRLVLVSSSPGQIMFPGRINNLLSLATPNRFATARRQTEIAEDVYGGRAKYEPALIRENAENAIVPSFRGYWTQLLAVAGFSSLPWLHRLQQPTLILAGDDDPIVPLVNARLLNLLIARSRLQVIKGAGHLLLVTRTEDVARAVNGFLRRKYAREELPTKEML